MTKDCSLMAMYEPWYAWVCRSDHPRSQGLVLGKSAGGPGVYGGAILLYSSGALLEWRLL